MAAWEPVLRQVRDGAVPAAALRVRTELMYAWPPFPGLDPELPAELLPADWPRGRAHQVFAELYDSLGPPTERRVRDIVAAHAPDLALWSATTPIAAPADRSRSRRAEARAPRVVDERAVAWAAPTMFRMP
ncbi:PaaX family transcriptional regulator C-terminal domain-containing protein [Thermomonospora catenispora]|uniref:PaaX family transcriptional regulator C-terminal domain-containing protein n=1 Tax=Thermomonospora catenispora TaxID=2493090 RepID=UPI001F4F3DAC|nr:PaaX family transcriptional regulator C-terminal domain-containing protein [Thermomonospora catenispora]